MERAVKIFAQQSVRKQVSCTQSLLQDLLMCDTIFGRNQQTVLQCMLKAKFYGMHARQSISTIPLD